MQHAPTLADVKNVKHLAKKLKQENPKLPYSKRLDLAASDLLGLRNYHELNRRFQAAIDQHLDSQSGPYAIAHCLYCDFRFAADLKDDQQQHRKRHELVMEVHEVTGYRPGTYVERETMKAQGHSAAANNAASMEDRVKGALLVLRAWFDRSYRSAIDAGKWRQHPSFDEYAGMLVPFLEELHPDVAPSLAKIYGRNPGVIPHGYTYWPLR